MYRPVDDHEHCRECLPPLAEALENLMQDHLKHARLGVELCERRYHLTTAVGVLALLERCIPRVVDAGEDLGRPVSSGMPR